MLVRLISSDPQFASSWFQWRQETATRLYNPLGDCDVGDLSERLKKSSSDLQLFDSHQNFRWFIELGDQIIGTVALGPINHQMLYAEISYILGEDFHGRGYGKKSVELMVEEIFRKSPLRKLIAYVEKNNIASCRLLESLGFQREGLLREHYLIDGQARDEVFYGLLKGDWGSQ